MQEHLTFRGASSAREPRIQEHRPEKSVAWPVFMGSGPGPDWPSRNDTRVLPELRSARRTITQKKHECGEQADRRTPEGCSVRIVSEGREDSKWRAEQDDPH